METKCTTHGQMDICVLEASIFDIKYSIIPHMMLLSGIIYICPTYLFEAHNCSNSMYFTHFGLVMPYGDIDLGQHWFS